MGRKPEKIETREDALHKGSTLIKDPAFCQVSFSRIQTNGMKLYGSNIIHNSVIALKISESEVTRDLSKDWHFENKPFVEVYLSPTQFAELLTSMNVGMGVPGTLRRRENQFFDMPDMPTKKEQYDSETKEILSSFEKRIGENIKRMEETIEQGKPLGKKAQEGLKRELEMIQGTLKNNFDFVMKSYQKEMNKTVAEAKGQIDSFVLHTVTSTGLEALREQGKFLLTEGE